MRASALGSLPSEKVDMMAALSTEATNANTHTGSTTSKPTKATQARPAKVPAERTKKTAAKTTASSRPANTTGSSTGTNKRKQKPVYLDVDSDTDAASEEDEGVTSVTGPKGFTGHSRGVGGGKFRVGAGDEDDVESEGWLDGDEDNREGNLQMMRKRARNSHSDSTLYHRPTPRTTTAETNNAGRSDISSRAMAIESGSGYTQEEHIPTTTTTAGAGSGARVPHSIDSCSTASGTQAEAEEEEGQAREYKWEPRDLQDKFRDWLIQYRDSNPEWFKKNVLAYMNSGVISNLTKFVPQTAEEMAELHGMSESKVANYGHGILATTWAFLKKHDLLGDFPLLQVPIIPANILWQDPFKAQRADAWHAEQEAKKAGLHGERRDSNSFGQSSQAQHMTDPSSSPIVKMAPRAPSQRLSSD